MLEIFLTIFSIWLVFQLMDWLVSCIPVKPPPLRLPLTYDQKKKIKYPYNGDGTSLVNLIYELMFHLDDSIKWIEVFGINGEPKQRNHECFGRMRCEPLILNSRRLFFTHLQLLCQEYVGS